MKDFFSDWHHFGGKLYHRTAGKWFVSNEEEFNALLCKHNAEVDEKRSQRYEALVCWGIGIFLVLVVVFYSFVKARFF